jgi:hypothetical protein
MGEERSSYQEEWGKREAASKKNGGREKQLARRMGEERSS